MNRVAEEIDRITDFPEITRNGKEFYYIMILEVPGGKGSIQISNPKREIFYYEFESNNFKLLDLQLLGVKRYCSNRCGCNSQNRRILMLMNQNEARKLDGNMNSERGSFNNMNVVELFHSIQFYFGSENISVKARKSLNNCHIKHAPVTNDGEPCFPRAYIIDAVKARLDRYTVLEK